MLYKNRLWSESGFFILEAFLCSFCSSVLINHFPSIPHRLVHHTASVHLVNWIYLVSMPLITFPGYKPPIFSYSVHYQVCSPLPNLFLICVPCCLPPAGFPLRFPPVHVSFSFSWISDLNMRLVSYFSIETLWFLAHSDFSSKNIVAIFVDILPKMGIIFFIKSRGNFPTCVLVI